MAGRIAVPTPQACESDPTDCSIVADWNRDGMPDSKEQSPVQQAPVVVVLAKQNWILLSSRGLPTASLAFCLVNC